jgi:exonuclease SbcD
VLGALGITVVGDAANQRTIAPLHNDGAVAGWAIAVPFLRPRDLPPIEEGDELGVDRAHGRLIEGYRRLYAQRVEEARARAGDEHPIVATGHCYMSGGVVSELSERKIQVGHQYALPADIFPPALAYVALGHLHRAQTIGALEHVRYSGSPIPLSLIERSYEHQVLLVDFEGPRLREIRPLFVPRAVEILVIPEEHAPLADVLESLRALPARTEADDERALPLLEVRVLREGAHPFLKRDVERALEGKRARLVRIDARREKVDAVASEPAAQLETLAPADVFDAAFARARGEPPPAEIRQLFLELLETVERGEAT